MANVKANETAGIYGIFIRECRISRFNIEVSRLLIK